MSEREERVKEKKTKHRMKKWGTDRQTQMSRHTCTDRHTHIDKQKSRQTYGHMDRQMADGWTDRQTDG